MVAILRCGCLVTTRFRCVCLRSHLGLEWAAQRPYLPLELPTKGLCLMRLIALIFVLFLGLVAYIRLAPTQVTKWHTLPNVTEPGDVTEAGSFLAVRQIAAPAAEVLAAVEQRALATPRTVLLKGSVAEGMMTFQTRSAVMGFPDHTTVAVQGDLLVIYGRLRFGKADLGVNRARVAGWLETLGPLTAPL